MTMFSGLSANLGERKGGFFLESIILKNKFFKK